MIWRTCIQAALSFHWLIHEWTYIHQSLIQATDSSRGAAYGPCKIQQLPGLGGLCGTQYTLEFVVGCWFPIFYLCFLFGEIAYYMCPTIFKHTSVAHPVALANPINVQIGSFLWRFFFYPFFQEIIQTYVLPYGMNKAHQSTSHRFLSFFFVMLYSNGHLRNMFIYLKITIVWGGRRTCVFITITCHPRSIPTQAQEKILYL